MKRKSMYHGQHPFDPYPFETFQNGSWQPVERVRISGGAMTMHVLDDQQITAENIPVSNLRIRSRKATMSDCTCILRPGADVCVFSTAQYAETSDEMENDKPAWIDARIRSIERKPHDSACACLFYVSFYVNQGPTLLSMANKKLRKETTAVQINQIAILQKLGKKPCEGEYYRWSFSEDSVSVRNFKLFSGRFSTDLTWLVVSSVLKQAAFDVSSIQNHIVYQLLDSNLNENPPTTENQLSAINFKLDKDISTSVVVQFVPDAAQARVVGDLQEAGPLILYDPPDLRRSKRRYVPPERFLACDEMPEYDVDMTRFGPGLLTYKWEYEEMPLALSVQDNHTYEKHGRIARGVSSREEGSSENSHVSGSNSKSVVSERKKRESCPSVVNGSNSGKEVLNVDKRGAFITGFHEEISGEFGDVISRYLYVNGPSTSHKKRKSKVNFADLKAKYWMKSLDKKGKRRRRGSALSERNSIYDMRSSQKGSISATIYREWIRRCMSNIDATINMEQPQIIDQWKEFQSKKHLNDSQTEKLSSTQKEEEISEEDMLWKEMELALATCYLLEANENSQVKSPAEVLRSSGTVCLHDYRLNEEIGLVCRLCDSISTEIKDVTPPFLSSSELVSNKERKHEEDAERKQGDPEQKSEPGGSEPGGDLDSFRIPETSNKFSPEGEGEDNVWALIPELKNTLRAHQRRAFEFLWRNLAGSLVPALMEQESKKRGGCVISHSPGAGKTLLIIAFLVSYLKLFPGARPLVLAPKTTLYTWYKEIIKWKIPIPVYQIHGGQTYKGEVLRQKLKLSPGVPRNQDVLHVVDCLEKIQKWLAHPSVLLMGYTSFLTLTREDSNYAHRKYMAQVFRECPGLLILDEGHNPRSTKSRLRKALMKVNTGLRVLLSGTLFQNNFGEYFNTLCLARPSFVNEVLRELDPKYKKRKKDGITRFSLENRARKLFIEKVSKNINVGVSQEKQEGLSTLRNLTSGFIDVYEGGSSENLPGLECYTLMMKPTALQHEILVKLQNQRPIYKGFPLELELLITLGAIHPWLIRTTACSNQYFSREELEALEELKFDLKLGSKVRFVMSLVPRCLLRKEKVLIFCHNISPINLFLALFERFYGWHKGEEVLVLQGDIELFERGRVMDKFEEPGGPSRVMLASITACAEGISLTAASRVILLDSEWNPSKSKQAIARAFRPGQDKVVYVYQLLATGTLEEEKYRKTTWKEWVSSMIFSEEFVEDPSRWQAPKIEDELLREIVEEDRTTLFHTILKNEKASSVIKGEKISKVIRGKELPPLNMEDA